MTKITDLLMMKSGRKIKKNKKVIKKLDTFDYLI